MIAFSHLAGRWELYVNDMDNPFASGNIGAILGQFSLAYVNRILADYDGYVDMQNIDDVAYRIKFVPISDAFYTLNPDVVNSSFVEHEDGSLTFCLNPTPTT